MSTQWKGPHFIVIAAASALAFGGGYMLAARSRAPSVPPPATNISNGIAEPTGIPGFDVNGQAPRGRPDENELIARNAEPPEGAEATQGAGNSSGRSQPDEPRPRPPREEPNDSKPPPGEPVDEDPDFGPEGE